MEERIIIAGGRTFYDYDLLEKEVCDYIKDMDIENVVIISGTAKGADKTGEKFAENNGISLKRFPADWKNLNVKPCKIKTNQYGKYNSLSGMIRNTKMRDYAKQQNGHLIAFWDGKSSGTANMIKLAREDGLKVKIVKY